MNGIRGKILRFVISFAAIGLVMFMMRDKLHEAMNILRHEVRWQWFAAAIGAYFVGLALIAVRMKWVFRVQNIVMRFRDCFYLGFLGLFYNLFLPSAVGGDVARAYYAYKHSGKKIESATSVLLDRLLGFVALIIMACVGLVLFRKEIESPYIDYAVFGALGLMLFSMAFFGSRRFARLFHVLGRFIPSEKLKIRLVEIYHAIYGYRHHRGPVLMAILLSFISQTVFVTSNYWIALSLGAAIPFWKFFILIPVISIVSMAPSIGGLGVREASVLYLFSLYLPSERALAFTVLMDILIYTFSIAGGIIYAFRGGLKMPADNDPMQSTQD